MSDQSNHVCSNCGSRCGYDGRCGDGPYLVCKCGSAENSVWINDGRGGYTEYLNGAHPISMTEYYNRHYANGPSGYPINNPAFDRAVAKVLAERKDDAEQAEKFLKSLEKEIRKISGSSWDNWGRDDD
jgi:hypothetical protein